MTATLASAPRQPVRLIFIHHSSGTNWLADQNGGLGKALGENNYFVSDTNYGWGPNRIGDRTDIGHWWEWFCSPQRSPDYINALFKESGQRGVYSRMQTPPAGENEVILFKPCYPNSTLRGDPNDPVPGFGQNPIRGQKAPAVPPPFGSLRHDFTYQVKRLAKQLLGKNKNEAAYTIANAKGMYIELLNVFQKYPNKLFIAITAPPLRFSSVAENTRAFNSWLANEWLSGYPLKNVAVFDFYNVLTSNAGSPNASDLDQALGSHHRLWDGRLQHQIGSQSNLLAYPTMDDHANKTGNQKATGEFAPLLNHYYNLWKTSHPQSA
jgi:hypothetical protein